MATHFKDYAYCIYVGLVRTVYTPYITRGGQRSKCPNMCPSCTRVPAIHCPLPDRYHFCSKLKLVLQVTRECAWIHVGRSVCKLAGLKAHSDHQNPKKVALHGKRHMLAYIPNWLTVSFHFFCNDVCSL